VSRFDTGRERERQAGHDCKHENSTGMKQRTPQILYGYWNEVRAGRLAPLRLEIEPSRIAGILSETFMLERLDAATHRYRLAGTRLCELFGSELRGANFLDGWSEPDRAALEHDLATVCEQGGVCVLTIEAAADTRHRIEIEAVLLPLLHSGKTVERIIGAMSAASHPHWLSHEPLTSRRLLRHEIVWPDGRPHSLLDRSGKLAPFMPAPVEARPATPVQRQFRVLEGGRTDGKHDKR